MGERIEWEEIERWRQIVADRMGTGLVHEHVGRLLAALGAGEGMHEALAKHQRVGPRHEQECDWCRAMAAWRRCVAPRGEGA